MLRKPTKVSELKPEEDFDYFIEEKRLFTVCVEITVTCIDDGEISDAEICAKAVEGFRNGALDGDANVVASELLEKIKGNEEGTPFDLEVWRAAKCNELGIKPRPGEITRPASERTLVGVV